MRWPLRLVLLAVLERPLIAPAVVVVFVRPGKDRHEQHGAGALDGLGYTPLVLLD